MFNLPGKIPVRIHPGFWFVAAMIGFIQSFSLIGTVVWVVIIVLSVLVHEMGHAYTSKIFRQKPNITLVPFGGVTSYEGKNLSFAQQFIIVLNGPLFGLSLFVIAFFLLRTDWITNAFWVGFLTRIRLVNLFWAIINLLPILPMDGGQLLRIGLEAAFGVKGFRASLFIGMILAASISFVAFALQYFLFGAILFLFAFQSFDMWRKAKNITSRDRDQKLGKLLQEGEKALAEKDYSKAEETFQNIRKKTKKGLLFVAATQYLAMIEKERGDTHLAFELLGSIYDQISDEAVLMMHELAYNEGKYEMVTELASSTYQLHPSKLVALHNAKAYGFLHDAKSAGGWLQTAVQYGGLDKEEIFSEEAFASIRHDKDFQSFFPE